MNPPRSWLRKHGVGRLAYRCLYRPRQQFDLARAYGWRLWWRAIRGASAMRRAARALPAPAPREVALVPPICFLTGPQFVPTTLFCAHSFARAAGVEAKFEFLSDGGLDAETSAALLRVFPRAAVHETAELDQRVADALPPGKFPSLHALRKEFVLLRKLTDAMTDRRGYRLFLDSDMLFWGKPRELLARAAKAEPLYLADVGDDHYTMPPADITRMLGVPVADRVNSGLVGLDAGAIDWDLMERACALLHAAPGDQRLLEQTLWAIALGAQGARPLDSDAYRLVIDPSQWRAACTHMPPPVLLHYAWHARLPYSAAEWRRYLAMRAT
ncbi:MAG TPA: hypothetical protein VG710_04240 [Opitutus sp.]|nr:hypothetical protein [Opitutus sp.]